MPHISRGTQGAVPYQLLIGTGTIRPNNSRKRFYLRSIVLDAGGKPENPEKNLQKQIWTGNQMHVQRQDRKSNLDSMVHSARTANRTWTQWCTAGGGGGKNRYATRFPRNQNNSILGSQNGYLNKYSKNLNVLPIFVLFAERSSKANVSNEPRTTRALSVRKNESLGYVHRGDEEQVYV